MGRLQSGDDTLELRRKTEALERIRIRASDELGAVVVLPRGELGANTGVVKTRRHRVGVTNLAILVLEDVGTHSVENALGATGQRGAVTGGIDTIASSFYTEKLDGQVLAERVEHARGIATTTDAGDDSVWKLAALLHHLLFRLIADNRLERADNSREGMRTNSRPNDVVRSRKVDYPSSQCLVDCVAQGLRARFHGNDRGSEKLDTEHIQSLAPNVFRTHVDGAFHAELGTDRSSRDTVLASSSLGNNLGFAESASNEYLAKCVVDLVAAGVVQIFSLQPDVRSTRVLGEAFRKMHMPRPSHVIVVRPEFLPELGVVIGLVEAPFQLGKTVHERLGHVLPSEFAETGW